MKIYIRLAGLLAGLMMLCFYSGCVFVSVPLIGGIEPFEEKTLTGKGRDKILLVDISDIITEENKKAFGVSTETNDVARIKEELEKASKDKRIRAIIFRINSPGGTVTASDIIHQEILRFKKKHDMFITASLMNVAASGAYYVATSADRIFATPTTITGSIGVIVAKFNIKGLMDKVGVQEESIMSGDKKDILSPFRGSTPEERKIIQEIIDTLYQKFLSVIEQGRKDISPEELKRLADGRVFTAQQALDAKLIDSIGYLDDAIEMIKDEKGLKEARVITYHRPRTYKNNIYSQANIQLFNFGDQGLMEYFPVRFMYIWSP